MLFTQTQRKKRTSYFERKIDIFMNTQTKHILPKNRQEAPKGHRLLSLLFTKGVCIVKKGPVRKSYLFLAALFKYQDREFRLPLFERWRARGLSARNLNELLWAVQRIIQMENVGCINSSVIAKKLCSENNDIVGRCYKSTTEAFLCTSNFHNSRNFTALFIYFHWEKKPSA